jgi:Tol biopolymer transport system component
MQDLGGVLSDGGAPASDASDEVSLIGSGDAGACTLSNRWIAFDSDRDALNRNVFIARADGTDVRRLTNDSAVEREPSFSPDGRHVAFASDVDGTMQIYVLDVVTHAKIQVSTRTEAASRPSFSADGTQIVYAAGGLLYLANADGSGDRLFATPESPMGLLQA